MKFKIILLLSGLFYSLCLPPDAHAAGLTIDQSFTRTAMGGYIEILEDKTGELRYEDVAAGRGNGKWRKPDQDYPSPGFNRPAHWVRFTLRNNSGETAELFLQQDYPFIDDLKFFSTVNEKEPEMIETGISEPFSSRTCRHRAFVFPVKIPTGGKAACYVRYKTTGPLNIYLNLFSQNAMNKEQILDYRITLIYAGAMVLTAISAILIFLFTRYAAYLIYCAFTLFLSFFIMTLNGAAFQYILTGNPGIANYLIPAALCLAIISGAISIISFLNLRDYYPEIHTRSYIFLASFVLLFSACFFTPPGTAVTGYAILAFIFMIFIIAICIELILDKYRPAYFLLIAWSVFFAGSIYYVLVSAGLLPPGIFYDISLPLCSAIMVAFFPIALIDRYHNMQIELEALNTQLEEKVYDRTRDLFLSETGINAYIKMFNEFSGVKQDFVDPESIQNYLDNVGAASLDILSLDLGIISDLDELLNKIMTNVQSILHAQSGYIFLIGENNKLELKTPKTKSESDISRNIMTIVEKTFSEEDFILTSQTDGTKKAEADTAFDSGIRYILSVPIKSQKSTIGVCYLENSLSDIFFTGTTAKLLLEFLSQSASAIEKIHFSKKSGVPGRDKKLSSITEKKIEKVMAYVQENYRSDISREGLASLVNIHPDSLSRFFKLYAGKKINEFINELRIKEAAMKLIVEESSIIDIAYSVGFESLTTFNRAFSKIMKTTPTNYREKNK